MEALLNQWLAVFGLSLGLTLFIEGAFALALGKRGRALLVLLLVNVLTNPPAVLLTRVWGFPIPIAEALVVFIEGFIYQKSREFSRPYLFSLLANALSFGLGLILNRVL